ncbi:oligopeptide ABC transporter permease OppB [Halomonadaceae bacterium KBTZ08]
MLNFLLRRIGIAIPTLLVLATLSFYLMMAAPGGPFTSEKPMPPEVVENIEAKYGLDNPLHQQLGNYLWGVVTEFDFGPSFRYKDRTVNDLIQTGFPRTLTYGFWSFVFAVSIGVTLGVIAALNHNGKADYAALSVAIGGQVLPNFVLAPLLVLLFVLKLDWLPGGGWEGGEARFIILPVIALGTSYLASIARITRSSMLEVLNSDYIRTAKAKGMPFRRIIFHHALKPSLLPVVSFLGPAFVGMITGSFIIDTYFTTGGIGTHFVNGALNRDYSVIMGFTILLGALTITFNMLVDILYAWIDPKIRY